jgi:hypothetical protein
MGRRVTGAALLFDIREFPPCGELSIAADYTSTPKRAEAEK